MIKRLHHAAYRCRDSEETRKFYEDFLGLKLADALEISSSVAGHDVKLLHTFFKMEDGSFIAFFEVPFMPFEFKIQHDFDLHIALAVDEKVLDDMLERGRKAGIETRGPADHGLVRSIYFRDPNGYVVELAAQTGIPNSEWPLGHAHRVLDAWQQHKAAPQT